MRALVAKVVMEIVPNSGVSNDDGQDSNTAQHDNNRGHIIVRKA